MVFLGNPGRKHRHTRHNIAWMVVESWSDSKNLTWKEKFKGLYAQFKTSAHSVILLKPETYMNQSGESVQACAQFFKVETSEILVVHDDLELPFGCVDLKQGGGLAGHNGLRSIASSLGSRDYGRLRLGISRPTKKSASAHVLGKFTEDEQADLPVYIEKAAGILDECLSESIESLQRKYSKKMLINRP